MTEALSKIKEFLQEKELDGLFVHKPENLLYLSGFTGTLGGAFITGEDSWLLVDSRYEEQAVSQCPEFTVILSERPWFIDKFAADSQRIGYEDNFLTVSLWQELKEHIPETSQLIPCGDGLERIRMIKTPEEIDLLQKAVDIADDAFRHILPFIKEGVKEIDIATEMDFYMRKQGASGPSFDFIVACGERSALPHGEAGENKLKAHEPVLMDYGCIYQNYCSDITRTVFLGEPEPEMRQLYYIVKEGQQRGYRKAFPGVKISSAEKAVRQYFEELELDQYFGHSLGHGVGLEIHELPVVNKKNDEIFTPGMVFTLEPGIYIPEVGGIRI
ncbi:MAG: Xaa-Pro peptidase family protein, partial [Bacillota bacterium]|nr:Xaa-Pro peptidase family protein [Bacillota bacterium]